MKARRGLDAKETTSPISTLFAMQLLNPELACDGSPEVRTCGVRTRLHVPPAPRQRVSANAHRTHY